MNFGATEFVVVNDVRQPLLTLSNTKTGKPYIHLATVRRGFREYMAYCDEDANKAWIEIVDPKETYLLKRIADDNEFADIEAFLHSKALLEITTSKEHKIAKLSHVLSLR